MCRVPLTWGVICCCMPARMLMPTGELAANWLRIACRFWWISWRGRNGQKKKKQVRRAAKNTDATATSRAAHPPGSLNPLLATEGGFYLLLALQPLLQLKPQLVGGGGGPAERLPGLHGPHGGGKSAAGRRHLHGHGAEGRLLADHAGEGGGEVGGGRGGGVRLGVEAGFLLHQELRGGLLGLEPLRQGFQPAALGEEKERGENKINKIKALRWRPAELEPGRLEERVERCSPCHPTPRTVPQSSALVVLSR